MPPPDKISLHEYARQSRLKWLDEFEGWGDDEVVRSVLAKYPGDSGHVDVDLPKLFKGKTDAIVDYHSNRTGLDPQLTRRLLNQESRGNPGAVSPKGARGLMQLMPDTAKSLGVNDIDDPWENIQGGTNYLKAQFDKFKDPRLALAAYNAGPGAVEKYGNKVPPYKETQDYVNKILSGYKSPRSNNPPSQLPSNSTQIQGEDGAQVPAPSAHRPRKSTVDVVAGLKRFMEQSQAQMNQAIAKTPRTNLLDLPDTMDIGGRQVPTSVEAPSGLEDVSSLRAPHAPRNTHAFGLPLAKQEQARQQLSPIGLANDINQRHRIRADVQREATGNYLPVDGRAFDSRTGKLKDSALSNEVDRRIAKEQDDAQWYRDNADALQTETRQYQKEIKDLGPAQWLSEMGTRAGGALSTLLGGVADSMSQVDRYDWTKSKEAARTFRIKAEAAHQAAEAEGMDRGEVSKLFQNATSGAISSLPAMLLAEMGLPGGGKVGVPAAFGTTGFLESRGRGEDAAQSIRAATRGYAVGKAFDLPIPGALKGGLTGAVTKGIGTAAGTVGVAKAYGADWRSALTEGLTNAVLSAGPEVAGQIGAQVLPQTVGGALRPFAAIRRSRAVGRARERLGELGEAVPQELTDLTGRLAPLRTPEQRITARLGEGVPMAPTTATGQRRAALSNVPVAEAARTSSILPSRPADRVASQLGGLSQDAIDLTATLAQGRKPTDLGELQVGREFATQPTATPGISVTELGSDTVGKIKARLAKGMQMWRGVKEPDQPASDPGDLGQGTYHSTDKARAGNYGDLTQQTVQLDNPLVLTEKEAYKRLAVDRGTISGIPGQSGLRLGMEHRSARSEAVMKELRDQGYDGVVSVGTGRGELEIVKFPSSASTGEGGAPEVPKPSAGVAPEGGVEFRNSGFNLRELRDKYPDKSDDELRLIAAKDQRRDMGMSFDSQVEAGRRALEGTNAYESKKASKLVPTVLDYNKFTDEMDYTGYGKATHHSYELNVNGEAPLNVIGTVYPDSPHKAEVNVAQQGRPIFDPTTKGGGMGHTEMLAVKRLLMERHPEITTIEFARIRRSDHLPKPTRQRQIGEPELVKAARRRKEEEERFKASGGEFRQAGFNGPTDYNDLIIKGYDWYRKFREEKDRDPDVNEFASAMQGRDEFKQAKQRQLGKAYDSIHAEEGGRNPEAAKVLEAAKGSKSAEPVAIPQTHVAQKVVAQKVPDALSRDSQDPYVQRYFELLDTRAKDPDYKELAAVSPDEKLVKGETWKQKAEDFLTRRAGFTRNPVVLPPEEPAEPLRTLELGDKGTDRELLDAVVRRGWDLSADYVKAKGSMPPFGEWAKELNRVLPRTRRNPKLVRRAYDEVQAELAPTKEYQKMGARLEKQESAPLGSAQPKVRDLADLPANLTARSRARYMEEPETIEDYESLETPQQKIRGFARTLEDRGYPIGYDVLRNVHQDAEIATKVAQRLSEKGIKSTDNWVKNESESVQKEISDEKVAAGNALLEYYQKAGDTNKLDSMASFLARKMSDMARGLRMAQYANLMSPGQILKDAYTQMRKNYEDQARQFKPGQAEEITEAATNYQTSRLSYQNAAAKVNNVERLYPEIHDAAVKEVNSKGGNIKLAAQKKKETAQGRIRIRKQGTQLNMPGIHPDLPDWITIVTSDLLTKTVNYAEAARNMITEFGADVKPYTEYIYRMAGKDVLKARANEKRLADIDRVTKKRPEDFSPDEIEELLRIDKAKQSNQASARAELKRRATFSYPRKSPTTKAPQPEKLGPEKPAELARIMNELGTKQGLNGDAILGALKLTRTDIPTWEKEMADERGLTDKKKIEQTFKEAKELQRQAQEELRIRQVTRKIMKESGTEPTVEDVKQMIWDAKNAAKKMAKDRRTQAKVLNKLTMTREQKMANGALDLMGFPKAVKASMDMSAPGRQGWVLLTGAGIKGRHTQKEAFEMMVQNAMSWDSAGATEGNVRALMNHRRYDQWERNGGELTAASSIDSLTNTLTPYEESFGSHLANYVPLVARSNRAYSGYLDAVRLGYFDIFAKELESRGVSERENPKAYEDLVEMINTFTGRGKLKHESLARGLNTMLWSPKFMKSRFQFLGFENAVPGSWYMRQHPEVRRLALRTAGKSLFTNMALLGLAGAAGKFGLVDNLSVNIDNPDDPDWMKIRWNNTRYDISGGHVPVARFLYKVYKSAAEAYQGDYARAKKPQDLVSELISGKLAPIPSKALEAWTGRDFEGNKFRDKTFVQHAGDVLAPMLFQDAWEGYKDGGYPTGVAAGIPSFFGTGVSTYTDKGINKLKGEVKSELHRLDFTPQEILGQKSGIQKYDDVLEDYIAPAIQLRVGMLQKTPLYQRMTDEQKALQIHRLIKTIREEARSKAAASLNAKEKLELRESNQPKRERDAGIPPPAPKATGGSGYGKYGSGSKYGKY